MDITQLENTISDIAKQQGYRPIIVSEWQEEDAIDSFPAAWIKLPKVLYVEGREEGVICHSLTVALLDNCGNKIPEYKAHRLEKMEADMLEIMSLLSVNEDVVEICDMTITPRCMHTATHGDIAQICTASIESLF